VLSPVVFGWALDLAGGGRTSSDAFAWGIAWTTPCGAASDRARPAAAHGRPPQCEV
jgi:hypothetical protein